MPDEVKEGQQDEKVIKEQAEFDAAWGEDAPAEKKEEVPPQEEESTPPDPKADEGQAKETQQDPKPKEDPIPSPDKPVESEEAKRLREELEKERQRNKSWEGRIRAANERAKLAEEEAERLRLEKERAKPKEKDSQVPGDPDEEEAVKAFQQEFPDLPKPIIALVKRELLPIVQGMVQAELAKIEPVVKEVESIKEHIKVDTTDAHIKAITEAHSDWREIVSSGELDTFIDSQPSYVRKALEQVKETGETEEVIDMFSRYKDWKKTQTKPKDPIPPKDPPKDDIEDELAVPSNPGGPRIPKKTSKNDFDTAWEEANRQG